MVNARAAYAWCWGSNTVGELGNASQTDVCGSYGCSTIPVLSVAGHMFVQIATGLHFSCGRSTGGQVTCWGNSGKVGTTPTGPPGTPESVASGRAFAWLTAGTDHACAVAQEGSACCWGFNEWGQTGQAPGGNKTEPTLVAGGHTFSTLDAGWGHTCGVAVEGLLCWGDNRYSQLGVLSLVGTGPVPVVGQGQAAAEARR